MKTKAKKSLSILLAVMMIFVFAACGDGNNDNPSESLSAQETTPSETTTEVTTQPETEPDYENTNYIAPYPQDNVSYKIEEFSFSEAAESSGYSLSDEKFAISGIYIENNYIVLRVNYSGWNSTDFCTYNVIYDFDGNMIANVSNITLAECGDKSGQIRGVYGDYIVVCMSPEPLKDKYALYNLKTKDIKYIDYETAKLENGIIIVGNRNPDEESGFLYGALDLDLNEIIPIEYDEIKLASPELFIAKKGEKYGIVNFKNETVADFKYKTIVGFSGTDESENSNSVMDFEKNINKYAVAVDENDTNVLIDKKGNVETVNFETSTKTIYGRIMAQYGDKILIKHSDERTISDITGNTVTEKAGGGKHGFFNGYCTINNDDGVCGVIDANGKIVYSETVSEDYPSISISPVDQNGLFLVDYHLSNGNYKTKITDLAGNEIYMSNEGDYLEAIGYGVFVQSSNNGYSAFRVTAY